MKRFHTTTTHPPYRIPFHSHVHLLFQHSLSIFHLHKNTHTARQRERDEYMCTLSKTRIHTSNTVLHKYLLNESFTQGKLSDCKNDDPKQLVLSECSSNHTSRLYIYIFVVQISKIHQNTESFPSFSL